MCVHVLVCWYLLGFAWRSGTASALSVEVRWEHKVTGKRVDSTQHTYTWRLSEQQRTVTETQAGVTAVCEHQMSIEQTHRDGEVIDRQTPEYVTALVTIILASQ